MTLWLYKRVIGQGITYSAIVWWNRMEIALARSEQNRLQMAVYVMITGAVKLFEPLSSTMSLLTSLYKILFWATFIWRKFWHNVYFWQHLALKWIYFAVFVHENGNLWRLLVSLLGEIDICAHWLFCLKFNFEQLLLFKEIFDIMHIFSSEYCDTYYHSCSKIFWYECHSLLQYKPWSQEYLATLYIVRLLNA